MFRERNNKFYFCLLWISNGSKEEYRENVFEEIIKFMILFTNEKKKRKKKIRKKKKNWGFPNILLYLEKYNLFGIQKKKKENFKHKFRTNE